MTQEEKDLLLKDLCARIYYGVICKSLKYSGIEGKITQITTSKISIGGFWHDASEIMPYLRPMSSMTEEERKYISDKCGFSICGPIGGRCGLIMPVLAADWLIDFYNEHHLDFRGLIPMGIALEASEGMYKTK